MSVFPSGGPDGFVRSLPSSIPSNLASLSVMLFSLLSHFSSLDSSFPMNLQRYPINEAMDIPENMLLKLIVLSRSIPILLALERRIDDLLTPARLMKVLSRLIQMSER